MQTLNGRSLTELLTPFLSCVTNKHWDREGGGTYIGHVEYVDYVDYVEYVDRGYMP
jgi:hypothetical protein